MTVISIKLAVIKQQNDVKRILDNDAMFAGTAVPCNNGKYRVGHKKPSPTRQLIMSSKSNVHLKWITHVEI